MLDISDCESLNDIAEKHFGIRNYYNRERVKKLLKENGIDWKIWLKERKAKKEKFCLVCGKKLVNDQKLYCSHSCAATANNKKRPPRVPKRYCKNCGVELVSVHSKSKFCSNKCQCDFEYKEYIEKWKQGLVNGMRCNGILSTHVRRYLLEKTNHACEICGCDWINETSGRPIVEVHYKDGNAYNNAEENLQVLCPNHHALTHNYKNNNRNNGRKSRLKE